MGRWNTVYTLNSDQVPFKYSVMPWSVDVFLSAHIRFRTGMVQRIVSITRGWGVQFPEKTPVIMVP